MASSIFNLSNPAFEINGGVDALDGSNPTPIVTGIKNITAFTCTLNFNVAPGDNTSVLTYDFAGDSIGTVNVYAWKNTTGTDPTLVASTGTENFSWIAIGR